MIPVRKRTIPMRVHLLIVLLLAPACAPAGDPAARPLPEAPRSWSEADWDAPRRRPVPPTPTQSGAFPDSAALEPVFLLPEAVWSEIGRGALPRRTLGARSARFMLGVELLASRIPLRETVWSADAHPIEASDSVVTFATPWVPTWQLEGDVLCDLPTALHRAEVRMVGTFRAEGEDLLIEHWMEPRGSARCTGREGALDRLRAFGNDLEMFARQAVRRATPAPVRRP